MHLTCDLQGHHDFSRIQNEGAHIVCVFSFEGLRLRSLTQCWAACGVVVILRGSSKPSEFGLYCRNAAENKAKQIPAARAEVHKRWLAKEQEVSNGKVSFPSRKIKPIYPLDNSAYPQMHLWLAGGSSRQSWQSGSHPRCPRQNEAAG